MKNKRTNKISDDRQQKWLVLKENGWVIVITDFDSKPHGFIKKNRNKGYLAGLDCPCKPEIDWLSQTIIHNSFIDSERVEEAMKKLSTPSL